jgi:hypothetical protein
MKLSDAIMLGRILIEYPDTGSYCGCAIGMGLAALGYKYDTKTLLSRGANLNEVRSIIALQDAVHEWPWLNRLCRGEEPSWYTGHYGRHIYDVISEGFLRLKTRQLISLETLVDWIRSVEPEESENDTPSGRQQPFLACDKEVASANNS